MTAKLGWMFSRVEDVKHDEGESEAFGVVDSGGVQKGDRYSRGIGTARVNVDDVRWVRSAQDGWTSLACFSFSSTNGPL